ncbi:Potassium voltage-gated channel subfamily F member 1 [Acropora cervicornis]|uniref:Potassium voltage-gated channel subfamily F member 1 n=1 Tax=Acropora cervicornis TaxID=6130 RepID=A0AAD9VGZ8_ACRCE|nr:Potassium voltage-gated channel subfamily F member 1 [Acropora cervicornis]
MKTATILVAAFLGILIHDVISHSGTGLSDNSDEGQAKKCPEEDIHGVVLEFPPYMIIRDEGNGTILDSGIVFDYIGNIFNDCCKGEDARVEIEELDEDFESNSFTTALHNANIVFPVDEALEQELTISGINYAFYDIVHSPGYVLIGIAGVLIWALEYHVRNEDFPLTFKRGSSEGFWWATISITTVGYGDKAPKSLLGRLFSVLWILIGLVVITMFTATVTSALTNTALPEFTNTLEGMKVGLLDKDFEAEEEARYIGANPLSYQSVADLNAALSSEKVEGIFMERIQAYYYYKDSNDENLRIFKAINAKISYKMVLKTNTMQQFIDWNSCIKRRLEHPSIDRLIKNYTKPMKAFKPAMDTIGLLSGKSEETTVFLLIVLGILLGLFALGVLVECCLAKSHRFLRKTSLAQDGGFSNEFISFHKCT